MLALLVVGVGLAACDPKPGGTEADVVTTESGLKVEFVSKGAGPAPEEGNVVIAHYTGKFENGETFDSSVERGEPFAFTLGKGRVIKGWDEGFAMLHVGDKAIFTIPSDLAYGDEGRGPIPPKSTLVFDVEFLDLKDHSLADALEEQLESADIEAAQKKFDDLKNIDFGEYYVSENQLNGLGYKYLQDDEIDKALVVFKWNVELYPQSGNVYDSLGEAQAAAGETDEAIASYRKSLSLDPANENAEKMLEQLEQLGPDD